MHAFMLCCSIVPSENFVANSLHAENIQETTSDFQKKEKLQIIDNYLYMSIRKHNIINLSQPSPIMEIYTFYY